MGKLNGVVQSFRLAQLTQAINDMRAARSEKTLRSLNLPEGNGGTGGDWPTLKALNIWFTTVLEHNEPRELSEEDKAATEFWGDVALTKQWGVSESELMAWWQRIQYNYLDQTLAEMLGHETVNWSIPKAIRGIMDMEGTIRDKPLWLRWRKPDTYKPKKAVSNYTYTARNGQTFTYQKGAELAAGTLVQEADGQWYEIYEDLQPPFTRLQRAARTWLMSQLCHRKVQSSKDLFLFEVLGMLRWLTIGVTARTHNYPDNFDDFNADSAYETNYGLNLHSYDALMGLLQSYDLQLSLMGVAGPGNGVPS